jgi:hypothetical protein
MFIQLLLLDFLYNAYYQSIFDESFDSQDIVKIIKLQEIVKKCFKLG